MEPEEIIKVHDNPLYGVIGTAFGRALLQAVFKNFDFVTTIQNFPFLNVAKSCTFFNLSRQGSDVVQMNSNGTTVLPAPLTKQMNEYTNK